MSSQDRYLIKLKREMGLLEKQEMKVIGSIETLLKSLKRRLGDHTSSNKDVTKETKQKIKNLNKKKEKAKQQLKEKIEQIDKMVKNLED